MTPAPKNWFDVDRKGLGKLIGGQQAPPECTLPQLTIGVEPVTGRMYWCDGSYEPKASRPTYFGSEAVLTLPQLRSPCTLVAAKKGER